MRCEKLLRNGNDSLAIGAIWAVTAAAFSCPICIFASIAFFANSIWQKIRGD